MGENWQSCLTRNGVGTGLEKVGVPLDICRATSFCGLRRQTGRLWGKDAAKLCCDTRKLLIIRALSVALLIIFRRNWKNYSQENCIGDAKPEIGIGLHTV